MLKYVSMEIKDRVALITGATSGIGKAVCKRLPGLGVKTIGLVDLNNDVYSIQLRC